MSVLLLSAGTAVLVCTLAALLTGRIQHHTANGLFAIVNGLCAVSSFIHDSRLGAVFNSAVCAYSAWHWWNGGGGDSTRRLKSWAATFRGVRRTAPTGA